ncbi:MAG: hypothetical protein ACF8PN_05315 [Phycisphaerales bacterium]
MPPMTVMVTPAMIDQYDASLDRDDMISRVYQMFLPDALAASTLSSGGTGSRLGDDDLACVRVRAPAPLDARNRTSAGRRCASTSLQSDLGTILEVFARRPTVGARIVATRRLRRESCAKPDWSATTRSVGRGGPVRNGGRTLRATENERSAISRVKRGGTPRLARTRARALRLSVTP